MNILKPPIETQYLIAVILYIITYVYVIQIAPRISKSDNPLLSAVTKTHETCVLGVQPANDRIFDMFRGKNYYIGNMSAVKENQLKNCLITFWGATHFNLYFCLGLFCPDLFLQTFIVGALFEAYEYANYDCHDGIDLILNSAGFLLGRTVNGLMR